MNRHAVGGLLVALLLAVGEGCDTNNDIGPGTELPPQECDVAGKEPLGDPPEIAPVCEVDPIEGAEFPCSCPDFDGTFPPGTFDWELTRNPDACGDNDGCEGCNNLTHFAWPDCAYVAEASGMMVSEAHFNRDEDNDHHFDICVEPNSGFVAPFTSGPMEIRNSQAYGPWGNHPIPRVHIEVQDCRYYDGAYIFGDVGWHPRGRPGDLMSVAGDWVVDDWHERDNGAIWLEIHEACVFRSTRAPSPPAPDHSFRSTRASGRSEATGAV